MSGSSQFLCLTWDFASQLFLAELRLAKFNGGDLPKLSFGPLLIAFFGDKDDLLDKAEE